MNGAELRLHEVPYSLAVDGRLESGIIDALYRREGSWTVVEFKTDRVKDQAELERLLEDVGYSAQTKRYIAAVERLVGQAPRCVLCLLNFAERVHLLPPEACG
jgi:ATP-dependent exoDNAse (exonuclease V) beta subunit